MELYIFNMQYNIWKGVKKTLISLVIVGLPLIVGALPADWQNLTLSGVVILLLNYIKVKHGLKI